ncbi:MAG TPA: hypothetical protein VGU64_10180 [Terriglobales bacterium]|nr:hypothetical protein [Terriglobales bacterium]
MKQAAHLRPGSTAPALSSTPHAGYGQAASSTPSSRRRPRSPNSI